MSEGFFDFEKYKDAFTKDQLKGTLILLHDLAVI